MSQKIKYQGKVAETFQRNISSKKGSYRLPAGKLKELYVDNRMNIFDAYNFGNNRHLSESQFKALIDFLIVKPEKGKEKLGDRLEKGTLYLVPVYIQSEYCVAQIHCPEDSETWTIEINGLEESYRFSSHGFYLYFK